MKDKAIYYLILAAVGVSIFVLSDRVIWITDCITYQYNFATGEKIGGIMDIFESQAEHYFTWNGRYVAHWLCQLFIPLLGKGVFSAVNALMYMALIILVIRNNTNEIMTPARLLTASCLVLFFCDTDYGPTCQIGYVWMAVLVLGWIHVFFRYAGSEAGYGKDICLLIGSIIAGNAQEAINIGVGGALIVYAMCNIRRMTRTQWCMAIGFGIGGLLLCLSPGTMNRTNEMTVAPLYSLVSFVLNLRAAYLFMVILAYNLMRRRISIRDFYRENSFLVNAIIVLIIFNFLIGVGSNRQLFGIELFSSILTLRLLKGQTFSPVVTGVFTAAILCIYAAKYQEIRKAERAYNELAAEILANPDGPVYIDFPAFNSFIRPTPFFRYGVYLDYAFGSVYQEQTGRPIESDDIRCYPKKTKELLSLSVENQVYEYLPGEFMLMQSKEHPKDFTLHRSINIFGIRIPLSPYNVEFPTDSPLDTEDYRIMYLPKILPIIDNEKVTMSCEL